MFAVLALTLLAQASSQIPARESRSAFGEAVARVEVGWSKEQVKGLLGPPDETEGDAASGEWEYGTTGAHTLATLGMVAFQNGTVFDRAGVGDPPPVGVIEEKELLEAVRSMYVPASEPGSAYNGLQYDGDSLHLLRVANMLIRKGQDKSLAIIGEFARLNFTRRVPNWLYWVIRTAYTSNLPGGVFEDPSIGVITPPPPDDPKRWPTFPVMVVDNWPLDFFVGAHIDSGGIAWDFAGYLRENEKNLSIRQKPFVPPDDPFLSYEGIDSPEWSFPKVDSSMDFHERHGHHWDKRKALQGILTLISGVFQTVKADQLEYVDTANYESFHRQFLALGAHWDPKKETYVTGQ